MMSILLLTDGATVPFWLACDGKSVLMRLWQTQPTDPNEPHANLLSATRHLMKHGSIQANLNHIKGHQDLKKIGPYTRDGTLNIKADTLAWEKLDTYQLGPKTFHIPWSQEVCYAGTHQIKKDFNTNICNHLNGQKTIEYWTKQRLMLQGIWKKLTGPQLDKLWKNYLLIINVGYPNMSLVTSLWGKTCNNGIFDPQHNAWDAVNHRKISTISWPAQHQQPKKGGRNWWRH